MTLDPLEVFRLRFDCDELAREWIEQLQGATAPDRLRAITGPEGDHDELAGCLTRGFDPVDRFKPAFALRHGWKHSLDGGAGGEAMVRAHPRLERRIGEDAAPVGEEPWRRRTGVGRQAFKGVNISGDIVGLCCFSPSTA